MENKSAYRNTWGQFMVVPTAFPENDHIGIMKMSITYTQEDDTNHRTEDSDPQTLTIETEDALVTEKDAMEGDVGYYFVLKTDRWAITDEKEMADIIRDFRSRLSCEKYKIQEEDGKEKDTED